jgi:hypothetical protein
MTNSGNTANRTDIFAALSDESNDENGQFETSTKQQNVRQRVKAHREVHSDR